MSIIIPTDHTAPVFSPQGDYSVVKYMDLTKFISLLQRKSLFFCRLDKLDDQFEGTTPKTNFDYRVKWHQYMRDSGYLKVQITDDQIIETVREQYENEKKFKPTFCVNCWNKKDDESAALWKIYADFNKGIMIKSTISRLEKSFKNEERDIQLSEIHYLHYEKEMMPDFNLNFPVIHKDVAYNYEEEVRLIYQLKQSYWNIDWAKEEVEEGLYLSSDLNELIEEIIIGPYSPKWFYNLVQDISKKYELERPIKKSRLSLK
jgi:hypothetical protein